MNLNRIIARNFFPTRFRKQLWTNVAVKQLMMMMVVVGDTDAKQHGGALDLKLRLELVVEKQLQLIKVTHNCEAFFNFTSIIKVVLATGPSKKGRMIWNFVVAKIKKISSTLIKFWKLWPQTSVFSRGAEKQVLSFVWWTSIARSIKLTSETFWRLGHGQISLPDDFCVPMSLLEASGIITVT